MLILKKKRIKGKIFLVIDLKYSSYKLWNFVIKWNRKFRVNLRY